MKNQLTVMIIDDDEDDLQLFCEAIGLIDSSIKRVTCTSGLTALEMVREVNGLLPDFIIVDINMPVINGKECLMELKKITRLKNVPVIMCSTSKYIGDQEECAALGADFYLVKQDTLIKTISAFQYILSLHEKKSSHRDKRELLSA